MSSELEEVQAERQDWTWVVKLGLEHMHSTSELEEQPEVESQVLRQRGSRSGQLPG